MPVAVADAREQAKHMRFRGRAEAGRELARHLGHYADRSDAIVLALPRGGVPVAFEVARALRVLLDVFVVRKLACRGILSSPWVRSQQAVSAYSAKTSSAS